MFAAVLAYRIFVPTGFMPDEQALAAGRFALVVCNGVDSMQAAADRSVVDLPAHGAHHSNVSKSESESSTDTERVSDFCPFGVANGLVALLLAPPAAPAGGLVSQHEPPPHRHAAELPSEPAGHRWARAPPSIAPTSLAS